MCVPAKAVEGSGAGEGQLVDGHAGPGTDPALVSTPTGEHFRKACKDWYKGSGG